MFSRVERVDRVEILFRILDLIHQSWTVDLLQKGLTLLLKGVFVKCNFMITPSLASLPLPLSTLYPTYTFSVYSVYSRLLGAPLRGSRSLGFLDFVSLSG